MPRYYIIGRRLFQTQLTTLPEVITTMDSRISLLLRVVMVVLVVVILGIGAMFVREVAFKDPTPRTEAERAVVASEEAVRANPEDPAARTKLASAYLERGAVASAIEQAQIAVRLAPSEPAGYYVLGLAQRRNGDSDAAIKSLETAVATEGQLAAFYQDAYAALSRAYEDRGDEEKAIEAMDESIKNGPENVVLLVERAKMYERLEKWAEAIFDYTLAMRYVPNYEPAVEGFDNLAAAHPDAYETVVGWWDEIEEEWGDEEMPAPVPHSAP
jgi:tetratricopeptide (TPR) repeat protein